MRLFNNSKSVTQYKVTGLRYLFVLSFLTACMCSDAQSLELQGVCSVNCGASQLCMDVQVRAADANTFQLGTSSILFVFNQSAITFSSYTAALFDDGDLCNAGSATFDNQTFDAGTPGRFSMSMILLSSDPGSSCPEVDDQAWLDVGEVCFTIVNSSQFPNIRIDSNRTHFNTNVPDNGMVEIPVVSYAVYHATCATDTDGDGIANTHDNCQTQANPLQEDSDDDGIGDVCDPQCNFPVLASPDQLVCQGSQVTMSALSEGGTPPFTYLWSTGAMTSSIEVTANALQQYHVTMTDDEGCIGNESTQVNVTSGGITAVLIFDLDTETIFDTIHDGDTFYYSSLPPEFNIQVVDYGSVSSIGLVLEGAQYITDYENSPPYRFPGDFEDFEPWTGHYTMTLATYTQNNLQGISCDEQVMHFNIVDDCATLALPDIVPLCIGETVTIHSGVQGPHGTYSVQWSNGMVGDSITITPNETFYLIAEVIDQSNCTTQDLTEVHVTSADIVTLLMIDSDLGTIWDTVKGGEIYHVDSFPPNIHLEAIVTAGNTESVGFDLSADFGVWGRTDNQPPYVFPGGNIDFWQDNFTMTVAAWDGEWRTGYSCGSYSFSFQVVDYNPTCNLVTHKGDSGVGSLPYALNCAQWWQTVYFDPAVHHDTIVLQSNHAVFHTGCDLSALKEHEVYIKAEGTPYALYINPGTETRIDGVHIISGSAAVGAGIYNEGTVTLENVTVYPGQSTEEPVFNVGTMNVRGSLDVKEE